MNVILMLAIMIGVPSACLVLAARFEVKKATAITDGDYGQALIHEDTAYAVRAIGWFVSGMMAMALMVSPFVGGYSR
jgi:hypothetical protein